MMDEPALDDLHESGLLLEAEDDPEEGILRISWSGRASHRRPIQVVGPYLDRVTEAARSRGRALEFRFERIEHCNSSTILVLMRLIQDLRVQGTRLTIVYDAAKKWQKMTFEALRQLDREDGLLALESVNGVGPENGG